MSGGRGAGPATNETSRCGRRSGGRAFVSSPVIGAVRRPREARVGARTSDPASGSSRWRERHAAVVARGSAHAAHRVAGYGAIGIALAVIAIAVAVGVSARTTASAQDIDTKIQSVARTMDSAATTLEKASSPIGSAGQSVGSILPATRRPRHHLRFARGRPSAASPSRSARSRSSVRSPRGDRRPHEQPRRQHSAGR